jgi:pimeloyl-ACP methyl ester carboxylesterase
MQRCLAPETTPGRIRTLPVLAIGGGKSSGERTADTMKLVADNVQTAVIPESRHWVAEETPEQLLAALTPFLAQYRDAR